MNLKSAAETERRYMVYFLLTERQSCTILSAIKYESTYYEYDNSIKLYYEDLIKLVKKESDYHFKNEKHPHPHR